METPEQTNTRAKEAPCTSHPGARRYNPKHWARMQERRREQLARRPDCIDRDAEDQHQYRLKHWGRL